MKILHIITGLSIGGAELALLSVLSGGLIKKNENIVISLMDKGDVGPRIEELGVPVYGLGLVQGSLGISPLALIKLRKIVLEFEPDIVQGWMYHGNLVATLACFMAPSRKKSIVSWNIRQSLYSLEGEKRLTKWVIRGNCSLSQAPKSIIYNSRLSQSHHEKYGFGKKHGRIIYNGFDCDNFRSNRENREIVRAEFGIKKNAIVVGHSARFHPMKDHVTFLQAASRLAVKHKEIHFLMIGRDIVKGNTVLEDNSKEIPADRLHMLGERHDVPRVMAAMDMLCQSSWSEAFPNVVGEAMAMSLPCVVTDVGDSSILVADCGEIVKPRDVSALQTGIERILSLSDASRSMLGDKARKRIESNYSIEGFASQYDDLYNALIVGES